MSPLLRRPGQAPEPVAVDPPPCPHRQRVCGICLDCADGLDGSAAEAQRTALGGVAAWLNAAGAAMAELSRVPSDSRYGPAVAKLVRRQATYRAVIGALAACPPAPEQRYPFAVKWSRERGVLMTRDVFTGEWLAFDSTQAPDHWRWWATTDARAERAKRGAA